MSGQRQNKSLSIREITIFSMLGAIMFLSKLVMEFLPNIHLMGTLVAVYTLVYRKKALVPIYVCVFLIGVYGGFDLWWMPYLYIWTILWGAIMLIPKSIGKRTKYIIYPIITAMHGLLFGILYAPAQALLFKLDFQSTIAWIIAGIRFDVIHCIGNLVLGFLIPDLTALLIKLSKKARII